MKITKLLLLAPKWSYTITVIAAVLYLTLVPDPVPEMDVELFPGVDKVVHAIMMMGVYLCIAFDMMRIDRHKLHRLGMRTCAVTLVITVLFGGGIELLQSIMALGRGCEIADFWADITGAVIGFIIVRLSPWPYPQPCANHHPVNRD